jgi:hypothetical protein
MPRRCIDQEAIHECLHLSIRLSDALMLAEMLGPRSQHKTFDKAVVSGWIFVNTPSERSVAPTLARQVQNGIYKVASLFGVNLILDCDEHWTAIRV